jgi:hypothetical protein
LEDSGEDESWEDAQEAWMEKWVPPCPLGYPQRLLRPDSPLGERVVIDENSGEPLPMYIPRWGTGEPSLYIPRPAGNLWPSEASEDGAE